MSIKIHKKDDFVFYPDVSFEEILEDGFKNIPNLKEELDKNLYYVISSGKQNNVKGVFYKDKEKYDFFVISENIVNHIYCQVQKQKDGVYWREYSEMPLNSHQYEMTRDGLYDIIKKIKSNKMTVYSFVLFNKKYSSFKEKDFKKALYVEIDKKKIFNKI